MKTTVKTAESKQSAVEELGKKEKSLYYVIIGDDEDKVVINVGEKTYTGVKNHLYNEAVKIQEEVNKKDTEKTKK